MKKTGPGFLIAAAFIGPGTVTTATLAGANFGYTLLWAILFSICATLVLQEMAARIGIVTGKGLAEILNQEFNSPIARWTMMILIVCAIGIGNAAYQTGNLTGAAIGLSNLLGGDLPYWCIAIAGIAIAVLNSNNLKKIQTILTILVVLMSLVFFVTFLYSDTNFSALFKGLLLPTISAESLLTTIALIGTTVVPYNLFLHASLASQFQPQEPTDRRLKNIRQDGITAIGLGGLVTVAIVATAAATWFGQAMKPDIHNISEQLTPLLGSFAPTFFATGLFCAGLTSAITAPLATSYALCGAMGWSGDPATRRFKLVWLSVIVFAAALCFLSLKPLSAILLAQATNGLLLPFIAVCLLWFCNQKRLLQHYKNTLLNNLLGSIVVITVTALGGYKLWTLL